MSPLHQALLMAKPAPSGLAMPYQMTFSAAGLAPLVADGFVFDPYFTNGNIANVYNPGSVSTPSGADNDPDWTNPPTTGMPTPSGGYYLFAASGGASSTRTITLPSWMSAKYFTCWFGISSTGTNCTLRARYDNGAVRGVGGSNSLGYVLFSQASTNDPPRIPDVANFPAGATKITAIEFFFESVSGRITVDDLTFYE